MKYLLASFAVLVAWLSFSRPTFAVETGQTAQTYEKNGAKLDYLLYLPPDYGKEADKKWPLIVFLHGSGERGTDVQLVKKHGPPKIVEDKDSPLGARFVVVSPQCPPKERWNIEQLNGLLDAILAAAVVGTAGLLLALLLLPASYLGRQIYST